MWTDVDTVKSATDERAAVQPHACLVPLVEPFDYDL